MKTISSEWMCVVLLSDFFRMWKRNSSVHKPTASIETIEGGCRVLLTTRTNERTNKRKKNASTSLDQTKRFGEILVDDFGEYLFTSLLYRNGNFLVFLLFYKTIWHVMCQSECWNWITSHRRQPTIHHYPCQWLCRHHDAAIVNVVVAVVASTKIKWNSAIFVYNMLIDCI